MDQQVLQIIAKVAAQNGITVGHTFSQQIDRYINRHYSSASPRNRVIIESYLSDAALRIAKTDGKQTLEAEDAKAAVWLFHQPDDLTNNCAEAGAFALREESLRAQRRFGLSVAGVEKRLLSEDIKRHLDSRP